MDDASAIDLFTKFLPKLDTVPGLKDAFLEAMELNKAFITDCLRPTTATPLGVVYAKMFAAMSRENLTEYSKLNTIELVTVTGVLKQLKTSFKEE
jgi:hypothetical protein